MRLLNVRTIKLEEYFWGQIPRYAILSHCWGSEEVTFEDINGPGWRDKLGATKIDYACVQCGRDMFEYVWIDTCCIDKRSSAELSEAINSMYSWYEDASVCYVYLEDVMSLQSSMFPLPSDTLSKSRWFTRGWTLQELIAPTRVEFFANDWTPLGNKAELSGCLSSITTIPEDVLANPFRRKFCSVARKMSWAAGRQTTLIEDTAYSLLGIFGVNMPLLYGEGRRAFTRLQEEIVKDTDDQSLFAWGVANGPDRALLYSQGVLADSPAAFSQSGNVVPIPSKPGREPYSMTNKGLRINVPLWKYKNNIHEYTVAMLDCQFENDFSGLLGIPLRETSNESVFFRLGGCGVRKYPATYAQTAQTRLVYIGKNTFEEIRSRKETCLVRSDSMRDHGYHIVQVAPKYFLWTSETQTLQMTPNTPAWPNSVSNIISRWAVFVFYNAETDLGFAVILAILDRDEDPTSFAEEHKPSVKILVKPEGVVLDSWLKESRKEILSFGLMDYHFVRVHSNKSNGVRVDVSAKANSEEMLNQNVFVLEVMMNVAFEG